MSNFDFSRFASINYWLDGIAGSSTGQATVIVEKDSIFFKLYIVLFVALFAIGVIFKVLAYLQEYKAPLKPKFELLGSNFLSMSIVSTLWFVMRQAQIYLLGSRIWLIILIFWFVGLLAYIINYLMNDFKIEKYYYKK